MVIIDNYTPYFLQFIYTYNLDIENTQRNSDSFLLMHVYLTTFSFSIEIYLEENLQCRYNVKITHLTKIMRVYYARMQNQSHVILWKGFVLTNGVRCALCLLQTIDEGILNIVHVLKIIFNYSILNSMLSSSPVLVRIPNKGF